MTGNIYFRLRSRRLEWGRRELLFGSGGVNYKEEGRCKRSQWVDNMDAIFGFQGTKQAIDRTEWRKTVVAEIAND